MRAQIGMCLLLTACVGSDAPTEELEATLVTPQGEPLQAGATIHFELAPAGGVRSQLGLKVAGDLGCPSENDDECLIRGSFELNGLDIETHVASQAANDGEDVHRFQVFVFAFPENAETWDGILDVTVEGSQNTIATLTQSVTLEIPDL